MKVENLGLKKTERADLQREQESFPGFSARRQSARFGEPDNLPRRRSDFAAAVPRPRDYRGLGVDVYAFGPEALPARQTRFVNNPG